MSTVTNNIDHTLFAHWADKRFIIYISNLYVSSASANGLISRNVIRYAGSSSSVKNS